MSNRQWILTTIAAVVLVVLAAIGCLMVTDDYGLFRQAKGRSLPIFYADRMGKSLLSIRYVPSNFNALLVGPSSSVNWEPQTMTAGIGLQMYNESVEGGNASEEKLLVDQALMKGNFKVAIILLYPTMISSHEYHDGIDKVRWTEALGSLDAYVQTALSELTLHHHILTSKQHSSADGSHELRNPQGDLLGEMGINFQEDPIGIRNLRNMVNDLQSHNVRVVYLVPTVYEPVLRHNRDAFRHFVESMTSELPQAPLIDLTAMEYQNLRSDPTNYIDAFHMTQGGAKHISQIVNEKLRIVLSHQ